MSDKPADDKQRWRVSMLWADVPEENAALEEIGDVPFLERGTQILAGAIAVIGIVGSLLMDDGNDIANALLVGGTALPWLLQGVGVSLYGYPFAALVLGPSIMFGITQIAVSDTPRWADPDTWELVGFGFAGQFAMFLILMLLVELSIAPRRQATVITAAAYAVLLIRFAGMRDLFNLAVWSLAFIFTSSASVAIRIAAPAIARSRDAVAASKAAEERRRIARDVHDVVAHTLAVSMLHITAARMALTRSQPDDALEALEEAERHGRSSLTDVRRIIRVLRSDGESALDAAQPDLADISGLVERYRTAGLDLQLSLHGPTDQVTPTAGLAVFRVVQEALANAARHGDGSASVDLRIDDGEVVLQVLNPAPERRRSSGKGSGLLGMEERVQAVGGKIEAGAQNGQWIVDARIPVGGVA